MNKHDIKLKGFIVNQKIGKHNQSIIFTTKIKFKDLNKIFELSSRIEKNRIEDNQDSSQMYEGANQHFQRYTDKKRIDEIKKYLIGESELDKKNDYNEHIFPSSIILWPVNEDEVELLNDDTELVIHKESDNYEPKILIVDGQHRFSAVQSLYKERMNEEINNFEFPAVFILNTSILSMGKLFGYINKFQKPINSSLFYDIFGSYPGDKSELAFAHKITSILNSEKGFLKDKINMTGAGLKDRNKGKALFTQSYFIRFFLKYLKPFEIFREEYLIFENEDSLEGAKSIAKFLNILFEEISIVYKNQYLDKSCLKKTNGIGAFLRLIEYLYEDYNNNNLRKRLQKLNENKFAEKYFKEESIFSNGGSDGASSKLALYIKINIGFEYTKEEYDKYEKYIKFDNLN